MADKNRIIDNDVSFYTGEVEEMRRRMRRCVPSLEPYYASCIASAEHVRDALIRHREAMDAPHPHDTELER